MFLPLAAVASALLVLRRMRPAPGVRTSDGGESSASVEAKEPYWGMFTPEGNAAVEEIVNKARDLLPCGESEALEWAMEQLRVLARAKDKDTSEACDTMVRSLVCDGVLYNERL